jgi:sodium/proline symporter
MTRATGVIAILLLYGSCLLFVAIWAARRTHNANDFLLANRRVGLWFTALSFTANSTAPWLLLIVCGAAFSWGLAAVWVVAALLAGNLLNWFYVAPRLRAAAAAQGTTTVLQLLSAATGDRFQPLVVRSGVLILFFALLLQTGAQLHLASTTLADDLDVNMSTTVSCLTIFLGVFAIAGGYWAACASDVLQVGVTGLLCLLLPIPAFIAVGDWSQIQLGITTLGPQALDWFGGKQGVVALAFVIGLTGIGLAQVGQPQALNRFTSIRDERTLRIARWISCVLVLLLLSAMLICGWFVKVLYSGLAHPELALFAIGNRMLPPWLAGAVSTLFLCAILSSVVNQVLVAAASFSIDLQRVVAAGSIDLARTVTAVFMLLATCLVAFAPQTVFNQWLFAYNVMGAAFGPLLLVRLAGKRIRAGSTLGAMWAGGVLTILFHLLPDSPGDILERVFPFVAALGIALSGGEQRRNPDRADRSQDTVHDRVPI